MLSTTSEYALRALTVIAALPRGASILGRDLARHTGIPARYLSRILTICHNAGLVNTARGNNGGYWLARPADSIHIREVVALFDAAALKRGCLLWPGRECSESHPCTAHRDWRAVRDAYINFLEGVTLADISDSDRRSVPGAPQRPPEGAQA
jgi:Rrf2 family transcriptional regulator, iron-sulfur cluster assembly transcription factor